MRRLFASTLVWVLLIVPAPAGKLSLLGVGQPSAVPVTLTYQGNAGDANNLTTYTFNTQPFGTAAANRYIILGVTGSQSAVRTISSVTIGGVAATGVVTGTDNVNVAAFYIAAVPTGTTGTVVVTWSAGMLRCQIGIWSAVNLQTPIPTGADTSTASTATGSVNVAAGGVALGIVNGFPLSVSSYTWSGLIDRFDAGLDGSVVTSGADSSFASAQTPLAITATPAGAASNSAAAFVSFR